MAQPKFDYSILETIGSGSYSVVHRAKHKVTKEIVAVKIVAKKNLSKTSTDNLLLEIKLLKTLKHMYIVEMFDFLWDNTNIYIVMELCNAGDLSTYIKKNRKLPEMTCKFFLRQLTLALLYMRENNVSHFDLKPQNLLLTHAPNLMLKVADFGFAQHINLGEKSNVIKGSPLYMAPEILLEHSYNPSADLWSIGVILYECLFGTAPYSSKTTEELLNKIKTKQKIIVPSDTKISQKCRNLMNGLLVHDPKKRLNFDEYFNHDFLDLKHAPTDDNLEKVNKIMSDAVEQDISGNLAKAYELYCKGLQYYVPIIGNEIDSNRKKYFHEMANEYMRRAEEIKIILKPNNDDSSNISDSKSEINESNIAKYIEPSTIYNELFSLCASSPSLQIALDIGRQAELYAFENTLTTAIEKFKIALGILVPLLSNEPSGHRKNLLHQQIVIWMNEAEKIKVLISAQDIEQEQPKSLSTASSSRNCTLQ